jgi:hypothetical protein
LCGYRRATRPPPPPRPLQDLLKSWAVLHAYDHPSSVVGLPGGSRSSTPDLEVLSTDDAEKVKLVARVGPFGGEHGLQLEVVVKGEEDLARVQASTRVVVMARLRTATERPATLSACVDRPHDTDVLAQWPPA